MVAAIPQAGMPRRVAAIPQPVAPSKAAPSAPTDDTPEEKYDLEQIADDRSKIVVQTLDWWNNTIIPLDRMRRRKPDPANPYFSMTNFTPTQYTHSLVDDFINKGVPFLLSKGVSVNYTADKNPAASEDAREIAARIVRDVWQRNARGGRNTILRRAKMIAARGGYAINYDYPDRDTSKAINSGYPLMSTLYDLVDIQHTRDALNCVKRVIMARRRKIGELPPELRGKHDDTDEIVDFYDHWDKHQHGCVINGTEIVKPLTEHGYTDRRGNPMLPWVICLHDEDEFIMFDDDLQVTSLTPLKTLVGYPPAAHLMEACNHLSFMLTLLRFCVVQGVLPEKVVKGRFQYDAARRAYLMEESNQQDGVTLLDSAKNMPAILNVIQFFQGLGEESGLGIQMLTGMKQEISGTSAHEQTDLGRAPLDAMRDTLENSLADEAEMILAMVASNTTPSTAAKYQAKYNAPLPAKNPQDSQAYNDGQSLPMGDVMTGIPNAQITGLSIKGAETPSVTVNTGSDLPIEQSYQIGTTLILNDKSPFDPVDIMENFFHLQNPQAAFNRGLMARMYANPQMPFGDLAGLKQMLQDKEGELDPVQVQQLRTQIAQTETAAIVATINQKTQAIMQGLIPGSSSAMSPQQQAQGAQTGLPNQQPPPPGAPPPPPPGVQPGAPGGPPITPPGAPLPPNVTPISAMAPGSAAPVPMPQMPQLPPAQQAAAYG